MEQMNATENLETTLQHLKSYRDELSNYASFDRIAESIADLTKAVRDKGSERNQGIYSIIDQIKCLVNGIPADAEKEKNIGKNIVGESIYLHRKILRNYLRARISTDIRWMIRRDMPEVLDIEHQCFEFPWSEENFIRCLRQRNCIGMVAEVEEQVIGYLIYELHKTRLHILNIAVHGLFRHHGVDENMINKLKIKLSEQRRTTISLAVRETNLDAQLFFQKMKFKASTVLRDFYEDTDEDAYAFQYTVTEKRTQESGQSSAHIVSKYPGRTGKSLLQ